MLYARNRLRLGHIASIGFVLIVVGLWEWSARGGIISALFFPAPTTIAATLRRWVISGTFTPHLAATFMRLGIGGGCGAIVGLGTGLLMGWSRWMRRLLDPFIAAAHPLPKMVMLPLAKILFGIGETSKIALIAVSAFFPVAAIRISQPPAAYQIHIRLLLVRAIDIERDLSIFFNMTPIRPIIYDQPPTTLHVMIQPAMFNAARPNWLVLLCSPLRIDIETRKLGLPLVSIETVEQQERTAPDEDI